MRKFLTLFFILFTVQAFAQTDSKIGKASPELVFSNILNYNKTEAKLSDFRGKVVLIDYWATWCGPCIEGFPHLEALQQKFGNDLQIITITDDPAERIKKFLKKKKLSLPVVIDSDKKLASHFPHKVIPHSVLIDKEGIVRAITTPEKITEEIIKQLASQERIDLAEKKEILDFDYSKPLSGKDNITYQVMLNPYKTGLSSSVHFGAGSEYEGRRILAVNLSIQSLYEIAYQFEPINTIVETKDTEAVQSFENGVCFDLIVPKDKSLQRFDIMKQQLDFLFNYTAKVENRLQQVKVLKVIDGKKAKINVAKGGEKQTSWNGNGMQIKNAEFKEVTIFLAAQLQKPVVDETGLKETYNLDLAWYNEEPERIHAELKELGLELIDAEREVAMLVITDK